MDQDELRSILNTENINLWNLIEAAIKIAASDHGAELRLRREGFVEKLYANKSQNLKKMTTNIEEKGSSNPQPNRVDSTIGYEQRKFIVDIKESLKDPNRSEESLIGLLQDIAGVNMTFKALEDTDIGRHVNSLRKHPSIEVQKRAKQLVRKWKGIVDDWVRTNLENKLLPTIPDANPSQKIHAKTDIQNEHQTPESACSPNIQSGKTSSNRSSLATVEPDQANAILKREAPTNPIPSSAQTKKNEQNDSLLDEQKLANAKKRLKENYQEAQNAKRQRTIQTPDLCDLPKTKSSLIVRIRARHDQTKH